MSNLEAFVLASLALLVIAGPMISSVMACFASSDNSATKKGRNFKNRLADPFAYNPATRLPMVGAVDVDGNPWGSSDHAS